MKKLFVIILLATVAAGCKKKEVPEPPKRIDVMVVNPEIQDSMETKFNSENPK